MGAGNGPEMVEGLHLGGGPPGLALDEQQLSLEVLQPREDAEVGGDEPGAFQDSTEATVARVW